MQTDSALTSPLVSILIPTYNHAVFLNDAIQSALAQTYPRVEIIVIDDGSTDNTRDIVARYVGRVRYIWQANQGLSGARNTGLRACTGEYIALLDADDLLEPEYLTRLMGVLQDNPNIDGAYCGYRFVNQVNALLPQIENRVIAPDLLYTTLLRGNFFVPESVLVHRSCYRTAGSFDGALSACEDWDMWLRFAVSRKLVGIPDVLVRYRVVAESMSSNPQRMLVNRLAVLQKHIGPEPCEKTQANSSARTNYAQAYVRAAIEYLQMGDIQSAYTYCFRAVCLHPRLLVDPAFLYELGCGGQPRGYRGDLANLDLNRSAQVLQNLLDRIFTDPDRPQELTKLRRTVYASAYATLSTLHYNAEDSRQARKFAGKALATDVRIGLNAITAAALLRGAIGPGTIHRIKAVIGSVDSFDSRRVYRNS